MGARDASELRRARHDYVRRGDRPNGAPDTYRARADPRPDRSLGGRGVRAGGPSPGDRGRIRRLARAIARSLARVVAVTRPFPPPGRARGPPRPPPRERGGGRKPAPPRPAAPPALS